MANSFEADSRRLEIATGPIIILNPRYRRKLDFQNIIHLVIIFYWRQLASKPFAISGVKKHILYIHQEIYTFQNIENPV